MYTSRYSKTFVDFEDVIEWLRQHKETPKHLRPIKPKLGAPSKAERVAKRKADEGGSRGSSFSELTNQKS